MLATFRFRALLLYFYGKPLRALELVHVRGCERHVPVSVTAALMEPSLGLVRACSTGECFFYLQQLQNSDRPDTRTEGRPETAKMQNEEEERKKRGTRKNGTLKCTVKGEEE